MKWEYKVIDLPSMQTSLGLESHLRLLESMGNDGWELCSTFRYESGYVGWFKRPKASESPYR